MCRQAGTAQVICHTSSTQQYKQHIYVYIYVYKCTYIRVYVCMYVCKSYKQYTAVHSTQQYTVNSSKIRHSSKKRHSSSKTEQYTATYSNIQQYPAINSNIQQYTAIYSSRNSKNKAQQCKQYAQDTVFQVCVRKTIINGLLV
jgi:hypothetical protein